MRGFVALTDPEWYEFLSRRADLDEVNFWQPRGGRSFRAVRRGEPILFKLRAPHKAIAGFGFFERFERLPAWLAWDCFGPANGAPDFESMIERIVPLRRGDARQERRGQFEIGCLLVTAPVFFPREEWVTPPRDWPPTGIQRGKTYALDRGEGERIWQECLERARRPGRYWNVEVRDDDHRYGAPVPVRPRLGQGGFRLAVQQAYHGSCAVTREHSVPALEAAHIKPFAAGGEHSVDNGILLRRDLHRLFDLGYVTVTPDYRFTVGESLRDEFRNGRSYYPLHGAQIVVPDDASERPSRDLLAWHREEVFLG